MYRIRILRISVFVHVVDMRTSECSRYVFLINLRAIAAKVSDEGDGLNELS